MTHVIILAAGSVRKNLAFLRSRCPSPALIPLNTRPLAAYLIDFYAHQEENYKIHLVVSADVAAEVRAELGVSDRRFVLDELTASTGVVDSLAQTVARIGAMDDVIVNVVTTVPTRLVHSDEVLLADKLTQTINWSGVRLEDGQPHFFFKASQAVTPTHAFTGIFRSSGAALKNAITETMAKNDLLAVVEQLHAKTTLRYSTCDWIDCGHEINYYEAKAKLVSSRSFNRIRISLEDGVLSKQSEDGDKLTREVDYVNMLPPSIQVYFPRVLTRRPATADAPGLVQMEYYGYPTVAECLLYWDLTADNWRRLFVRLEAVLQRFRAFPSSIGAAAFEEFYFTKVVERLEKFLATLDPDLRRKFEGEIVINGRTCRPFTVLLEEVRSRIAGMYREKDFYIMHGDFCFNNLLYDVPSGVVRLIDPRGSFGARCVGIYGDCKYDLAKLKHSAEHGYDFLVNGLFDLRVTDHHFDYAIAARECCTLVATLSRELIARLGHDNAEIELLTSLLFLSMCPLHSEDRNRQLAMYVHGLKLLNSSLEN